MKKLKLKLFGDPKVFCRSVIQTDDKDTIKDKKRLPFEATQIAVLHVYYGEKKYVLHNPAPFQYDGATIPFGLCKGNPKLWIPALFHDLMMKDKSLINYDRFLSSLIFYKLLRIHKVNWVFAFLMFMFVDTWQRHIKGWRRNK
jgi:hypothetical protein